MIFRWLNRPSKKRIVSLGITIRRLSLFHPQSMWTQPQKWFHIVRIIDDGRTWAVHFQKRVCTKYNICHDLNCHLQQSKDDNWKRKLSPVDETIINGSKLVRSPKTDPGIKMERKKKAAELLLQISTVRCGITLCKSGTAGRLEWLVCTSGRPGCLAATKGDPTHVSDPKNRFGRQWSMIEWSAMPVREIYLRVVNWKLAQSLW